MIHSKGFKYFKNLIIGVGAAVVMIGALYKIQSWEMPMNGKLDLLTIGLGVEALIFLFLGLLGPEKDYYWEKLYPGLDKYSGGVAGGGATAALADVKPMDGEVAQRQFDSMIAELQSMSKSLGSLKALQEVDFSQTKDQLKTMGDFYGKMNQAMVAMSEATDDVKTYKDRLQELNSSLGSMNTVYSDVVNTVGRMSDVVTQLGETIEDTKNYKQQIAQLNSNLASLNGVYGNVLSAFKN